MNAPKALCLLGLKVAASVETSLGSDPKKTLNEAIFGQTQALLLKKKEALAEKVRLIQEAKLICKQET
jgi:hypothetical protein